MNEWRVNGSPHPKRKMQLKTKTLHHHWVRLVENATLFNSYNPKKKKISTLAHRNSTCNKHTMCMILVISPHEEETRQHFDFCLCFYSPLESTTRVERKNFPHEQRKKNRSSLFCVRTSYVSFRCFAFYWVLLTRCKSFE